MDQQHKLNMFILNGGLNLEVMLQDLAHKPAVVFDLETTHLNMYDPQSKVLMLGIGDDKSQHIIPLDWPGCSWYGDYEIQKSLLETIIETVQGKKIIGHNLRFDQKFLTQHYGVRFPATFDTIISGALLDENEKKGLKHKAHVYFGAADWDIKEKEKTSGTDFIKTSTYCAWDVYWTFKLYEKDKADLQKPENAGLKKIFLELSMPLSDALEKIEAVGVCVNLPQYKEVGKCISGKVDQLQKELDTYAPGLNWGSPKQVAKLMFSPVSDGGLGLKPSVLTKTGNPSTGNEVLKSLQGQHPLIDLKIKYNKYTKLQNSFIKGWGKYLMPNGRMYPSYEITGTVTGRLSCSKPNLQQVPRTKAIRSLITAPDGYTLVSADFSQIELRLAAMVAKEQTMLKIFNTSGGDIHSETAKIITGKETITKDDRSKAKSVNFGFLYGMGAKTFQTYAFTDYGMKISFEEATQFRQRFFDAYNGLPAWHESVKREAHLYKQVKSLTGRIRHLPNIDSDDWADVGAAEREAINFGIQSLGADLTICALIELTRKLDPNEAQIFGTVHDSIMVYVRNDKIQDICPVLKSTMENPRILKDSFGINFTVPIVADISVEPNGWGTGNQNSTSYQKVLNRA
jgi:DNA polymerase I-like protein with 3'-5' exonuclease and polymerase domains